MADSVLDRNISKYPKLKKLTTTDLAEKNAFLNRILMTMQRSPLTYKQALTACIVIDEESARAAEEE